MTPCQFWSESSPAGWDPITLVSLAFPAEYKFVYFLNLLGIGFPLEEKLLQDNNGHFHDSGKVTVIHLVAHMKM